MLRPPGVRNNEATERNASRSLPVPRVVAQSSRSPRARSLWASLIYLAPIPPTLSMATMTDHKRSPGAWSSRSPRRRRSPSHRRGRSSSSPATKPSIPKRPAGVGFGSGSVSHGLFYSTPNTHKNAQSPFCHNTSPARCPLGSRYGQPRIRMELLRTHPCPR